MLALLRLELFHKRVLLFVNGIDFGVCRHYDSYKSIMSDTSDASDMQV